MLVFTIPVKHQAGIPYTEGVDQMGAQVIDVARTTYAAYTSGASSARTVGDLIIGFASGPAA